MFLCCSFGFFLHPTEPYDSTIDLPYFLQGWLRAGNRIYLEKFIKEYNPHVVIEVGSCLGLSAMFMADRIANTSRLYAVDTFEGSAEHSNIPYLPTLYQQFLSNVKHRGLTHKIIPVKMASQDAAKTLDIKAQLIYIDAAHDYENVYTDIMAWYQHLDESSIICVDDYDWPGVNKAVYDAACKLNVRLNIFQAFWYFDPKKS